MLHDFSCASGAEQAGEPPLLAYLDRPPKVLYEKNLTIGIFGEKERGLEG
jgi:hypothetical protein